jgi:hypothetical protein
MRTGETGGLDPVFVRLSGQESSQFGHERSRAASHKPQAVTQASVEFTMPTFTVGSGTTGKSSLDASLSSQASAFAD